MEICLTTDRLVLRPLTAADSSTLQDIVSDPRVALSTASIPHPYPEDGATEFIARSKTCASHSRRSFAVTLRDTGELIGLSGYSSSDGGAEIRYLIAPSHWRRGFATEAAKALAIHLLSELGFESIIATAMSTNTASIRVLCKLGFERQSDSMIDLPLRDGKHLISNWRLEGAIDMDSASRSRLEEACPSFRVERILKKSSKSVVALGVYARRRAVMKLFVSDNRSWLRWLEREKAFYRAAKDPPVKIPELLAEGDTPSFLVLTASDGNLLSTDRLMTDVDQCLVSKLAQTAGQLSTWQAVLSDQSNGQVSLEERSARYRQTGHLTDENIKSVSRLVREASNQLRFAHGDLVGTNVIISADGEMALIDWEHAGLKLAGYDLAVLWVMCELSPAGKQALLFHLREYEEDEICGFLANLFVTYAREKANYSAAEQPISAHLITSITTSISRLQVFVDGGPPYGPRLDALPS